MRQKYEIPSRDINGQENDSDEPNFEKMSFDEENWDEPTQSQDIWNAAEYKNNTLLDEDDDTHISDNNPFAKQRLLKSKYKNLYSS